MRVAIGSGAFAHNGLVIVLTAAGRYEAAMVWVKRVALCDGMVIAHLPCQALGSRTAMRFYTLLVTSFGLAAWRVDSCSAKLRNITA